MTHAPPYVTIERLSRTGPLSTVGEHALMADVNEPVEASARLIAVKSALWSGQHEQLASLIDRADDNFQHLLRAMRDQFLGHQQQAQAALDRFIVPRPLALYAAELRCELAIDSGNIPEAIASHAEMVSCLPPARPDQGAKGRSLMLSARIHAMKGRILHARSTFTHALKAARQAKDHVNTGRILTSLGRLLVDLRAYDEGRTAHLSALRIHERVGNTMGCAASLGGLGLVHLGKGMTADGAQALRQAIHRCEQLHALAAEAAWRQHLDAALVLLQREELRIRELQAFIRVIQRLGDTQREAALWCELGNTWRDIRDPDAALPCYEAALRLSSITADDITLAVDHYNLGCTYALLERHEESRQSFEAALHAAPEGPLSPELRARLGRTIAPPDQP
ncbi:MAG: tetratricopeptide repeat protein [Myxococcota bacterium]